VRLAPGKPGEASYRLLAQSLREQIIQDRFAATQVYLPPQVDQSLEDEPALLQVGHRSRMTIIGLLDSRGAGIQDAEQIITAVAARGEVAERLQAPSGSPLLHIERLYRDGAGHPVELAISDFLPEHYSRRLRLGRAVSYSVTAAGGGPSP
jgi:hypothetical protein